MTPPPPPGFVLDNFDPYEELPTGEGGDTRPIVDDIPKPDFSWSRGVVPAKDDIDNAMTLRQPPAASAWQSLPPLPAGFKLDPAPALPPLPPGFKLDVPIGKSPEFEPPRASGEAQAIPANHTLPPQEVDRRIEMAREIGRLNDLWGDSPDVYQVKPESKRLAEVNKEIGGMFSHPFVHNDRTRTPAFDRERYDSLMNERASLSKALRPQVPKEEQNLGGVLKSGWELLTGGWQLNPEFFKSPLDRVAEGLDTLANREENIARLEALKKELPAEEYETYRQAAQATDWKNNDNLYAQLPGGRVKFRPEAYDSRGNFSHAIDRVVQDKVWTPEQGKKAFGQWAEIERQQDARLHQAAQKTPSYQNFAKNYLADPENRGKAEADAWTAYRDTPFYKRLPSIAGYLSGVTAKGAVDTVAYPGALAAIEAVQAAAEAQNTKESRQMADKATGWILDTISMPSYWQDVRGSGSGMVDAAVQSVGQLVGQAALYKLGGKKLAQVSAPLQTAMETYTSAYQAAAKYDETGRVINGAEAHATATKAAKGGSVAGVLDMLPLESLMARIPEGGLKGAGKAIVSGLLESGTELAQDRWEQMVNQAVVEDYVPEHGIPWDQYAGMGLGATLLDVIKQQLERRVGGRGGRHAVDQATARSTEGPVDVEQQPGKTIELGVPASQAPSTAESVARNSPTESGTPAEERSGRTRGGQFFPAAESDANAGVAETVPATELSQNTGETLSSGEQSPVQRPENPTVESRKNRSEPGEERPTGRAPEVPGAMARAQSGRTLAIKQAILEEERAEVQQGIDEAGPETTVGRILAKRLGEVDSEITKVQQDRHDAIRSLLRENNPGSPAFPNESPWQVAAPLEQRGASESHGQPGPLVQVGGTSIPGLRSTTAGERPQTHLSDRDLAAIARILQNPPQQSQNSSAREETSEQPSTESIQPGPASQQTSSSQPPKKVNPQGLKAKIDRKRQGPGDHIGADILREIVDYGRQIFRQGMEYFDWAMKMLKDLGEQVGPHLKGIFNSLYMESSQNSLTSNGQNVSFENFSEPPKTETFTEEFLNGDRAGRSVRFGGDPNRKNKSNNSAEKNKNTDADAIAKKILEAENSNKPIEGGLYQRVRDYGQGLFRTGMDYLDWANQMIRDLGRAVTSALGRVWRSLVDSSGKDLPGNFLECTTRLRKLQTEWNAIRFRYDEELKKAPSLQRDWAVRAMEARLEALAEESRDLVSIPKSARKSMKFLHGIPWLVKSIVKEGTDILTRYVSPDLVPKNLTVIVTEEETAEYHFPHGLIGVPVTEDGLGFAHEVIHDLEKMNSEILDVTSAFLKKRAEGKPPRKLSEITGDPRYGELLAYEDRWVELGGKPYTGAIYPSGTEILTTGIERLHENPLEFLLRDPEFFEVVVKCLRKW